MSKKIKTTLLLLLTLLIVTPSYAQFKVGVTAGLNISKFTVSDDTYEDYIDKIRPGFTVGPTAIFTIPGMGLGFDASALFDLRAVKSKTYEDINTIYCCSFQFPVNIRYGLDFGDVYAFVFTGPQFGFSTGNKDQFIIAGKSKSTGHDLERRWVNNSSSFSWNFGVGGVVMDKIQIRVSYNLALKNTGNIQQVDLVDGSSRSLTNGKAHTCQVTLSYLF